MVRSLWLVLLASSVEGGLFGNLFSRSDEPEDEYPEDYDEVEYTGDDSNIEDWDDLGEYQTDQDNQNGDLFEDGSEDEDFPPIKPLDEADTLNQKPSPTELPSGPAGKVDPGQPTGTFADRSLTSSNAYAQNVDATAYKPPQWLESPYHPYKKTYKHAHQSHTCHKKRKCRKHCVWCPKMNKYVCRKSQIGKILGLSLGIPGGIFVLMVWLLFCTLLCWLILFGGLATLGFGKYGRKRAKKNKNDYAAIPSGPYVPASTPADGPVPIFAPGEKVLPFLSAQSGANIAMPPPFRTTSPEQPLVKPSPFPPPAAVQMTDPLIPNSSPSD